MNRYIYLLVCIVVAGLWIGWTIPTPDKSQARARQLQGLYIFTDCTPAGEYEVIGTISRTGALSLRSAQYESIRDVLIDRAKKQYPAGEGIIFDFRTGGTDKADVIKFK